MQVEVGDGFPSVGAVVDDHPEAGFTQVFLFRDDPDPGEEMAEEILVGAVATGEPLPRHLGAYPHCPRRELSL